MAPEIGISNTIPFQMNVRAISGSSAFEYTAIDNSFSMEFDGANSYMLLGSLNESLGITGSISFSTWVKLPLNYNGGPNPRIATFIAEDDIGGNLRNFFFGFRGGSTRGLYAYVFNTDGASVSMHDGTTINDNNWHHVAVTYDGTTNTDGFKAYVDGVNVNSETATSTGVRSTSTVGTIIGACRDSSPLYKLEGKLDELALWDKALSENTIQAIYDTTANNPGKVADLSETPEGEPAVWYRMGD